MGKGLNPVKEEAKKECVKKECVKKEDPEDKKADNAGTLFLVGTPIGNLKDITLRALEILQEVDLIAAEDTRQTQKLLNHYHIHKPVTSYYEHNKAAKGPFLIEELSRGKKIALVSDAGMPGISDPGYDLVRECISQKIPLTVIPGPSAVLTALVASGLDCSGFVFAGFFPRSKKEKRQLFEELKQEKRTIIFYESPYRLPQTLAEVREMWGERRCCVARELTKVFEEYRRGTLGELCTYYESNPVKGEITLLIEGVQVREEESNYTSAEIEDCYAELLQKGFSKKDALKETARLLKVPKREIYHQVMIKPKSVP
jgi:16S rRNA (cytidine1402-2'-O)-methyltransferase